MPKSSDNKRHKVPVDVIFGSGHLSESQWKTQKPHLQTTGHQKSNDQSQPDASNSFNSEKLSIKLRSAEPPRLHTLSSNSIEELHDVFKSYEGKLKPDDLRQALENHKLYYTDEQFERLFLKINTDRDWQCSWDEFISFLILEFEEDEGDMDKEELDPPIKERPKTKRTRLRHQAVKINYCPTVLGDRSVNMSQGSYVVAATDGTVNYYTLDWELQRSGMSGSRESDLRFIA